MKHLFSPYLRLFLSKPIGNLTVLLNCHQPYFWSRFFLTITLHRRKNPKEIHFKPSFKVGWQTFASGKVHRIDRIFWYDWNGIKGRITYKGKIYNRMKKAWAGKQWSLPGQTRKAACSGIDGLGCFGSSELLRYDARNVPLFALFWIRLTKGKWYLETDIPTTFGLGEPFYKRKSRKNCIHCGLINSDSCNVRWFSNPHLCNVLQ